MRAFSWLELLQERIRRGSASAAVRDAFLIVHKTRSLEDWGGMGFVVWHTGYFSICVWMALFLMTRPRLLRGSAPALVRREGEQDLSLEPAGPGSNPAGGTLDHG
jgi:hypothetical protein